jgi:hypothetical protein
LRRALTEVGRERLRATIFGDQDRPPLNLERGLELEAEIVLGQQHAAGQIPEAAKEHYISRKLVALSQLAGVLARVNSETAESLDDGVKVTRTRQCVLSQENASAGFSARLRSALRKEGRNVQESAWHTPHLVIVHDVELPIPLYYFEAVVGDIESAYERVSADQRRSYNLHIDYHWEHALANLNPRKSELTIDWSLRTLAEALVAGVVFPSSAGWHWMWDGKNREDLGTDLAAVLYSLGEYHLDQDLGPSFARAIRTALQGMNSAAIGERCSSLAQWIDDQLAQIGLRRRKGQTRREDVLEQPVLRALGPLIARIQEQAGPTQVDSAAAASGPAQNWPFLSTQN